MFLTPRGVTSKQRETMETVFSGIQPSGELHLGNYLGAVRNWVELQESYRCFYCIVDYHAITQPYEPAEMPAPRARRWPSSSWPAASIPSKATLFVQSAVPEHTELAWVAVVGDAARRARAA